MLHNIIPFLFQGTILLLAAVVYADHKDKKVNPKSSKPSPHTVAAKAPRTSHIPKSHSFVRHARKLPPQHQPKLRIAPRRPSPRQSIQWKSKGPLRKIPLRRYPRKFPVLKSRQATGVPVPLPAFQNRPIQPIPPLRPVKVVPVQHNPRFRRLVTNLRQSTSNLRQGIQRGSSSLRQSIRSLSPLPFRPPFAAPGNRRRFRVPPIVFKRAEDMPGYEKFTLDEVIYPEEEAKVSNASCCYSLNN